MALDSRVQHDIGVVFKEVSDGTSTVSRASISLSPTGDIQVVNGKDKLAVQIARSLVNESVDVPINEYGVTSRQLSTLISLILRKYKSNQVDETNRIDTNFLGYNIYRKSDPTTLSVDSSDTFTKISKDPVVHKFVDTGLSNGTTYNYRISKQLKRGFEGPSIEQINITPSQRTADHRVVIGTNLTGVSGDQSATLYVNTNRLYFKEELMGSIVSIDSERSEEDPRRWNIEVEITTLNGDLLSLSIGRQINIA